MRRLLELKRTYFFIFVTFFVLFCFGLTSPSLASNPKKGGTIVVGINTDLTAIDPHSTPAAGDAAIFNHVYEPLIGYGDDLKIKPVLAERWEISPDFKTYTFYLRKGKLFHNGREMEAKDVKYSIDRMLNPKVRFPRRKLLKKLKEVEVVDKYTVRFHMKEKDAGLFNVLCYTTPVMAIVPKEETEKEGGLIKNPIGTGPYKFVEWKPDRHVILERFEQYKAQPGPKDGLGGERIAYLDKIKFVPIPEESVAIMALLNKEVDFYNLFPPKYMKKYEKTYKKRGLVIDKQTGLSTRMIRFGCTQPITSNVKFRKAVAYAIDRKKITQAATMGYATLNASYVPVSSHFFTPYHKTWYKRDLAKAKQLLKEAGYKGETVVIDTTKQYAFMYQQAVALQSELAEAGIKTKINVLEWPLLIKKYRKAAYQMLSWGGAGRGNPALTYVTLRRPGFTKQFPEMEKIIQEANNTVDEKKLTKLFEKAHKIFYEGVPMIMLYNPLYLQCRQKYVKGYTLNPIGQTLFWGVWLDK